MNDKRNQIITALKIIKSECEKHKDCEDSCPFCIKGICEIQESPALWQINDYENWKALGEAE